jgi:hypothetical protein
MEKQWSQQNLHRGTARDPIRPIPKHKRKLLPTAETIDTGSSPGCGKATPFPFATSLLVDCESKNSGI